MTVSNAIVVDVNAANCHQQLLSGAPQTCGMRSGRQALAPGAECGLHSTKAHEETLVVLDGQGLVRLGGSEKLAIRGGQIVYVPPDTMHNVVNTGETILRYIYVVAPVAR